MCVSSQTQVPKVDRTFSPIKMPRVAEDAWLKLSDSISKSWDRKAEKS